MGSILKDKSKNIIKDEIINKISVRFQKVLELPFKDLRKLIDEGKKELKEGIVVIYAVNDGKVGLAVGVTKGWRINLMQLNLLKLVQKLLVVQGGGGRKDFAQAGGSLDQI